MLDDDGILGGIHDSVVHGLSRGLADLHALLSRLAPLGDIGDGASRALDLELGLHVNDLLLARLGRVGTVGELVGLAVAHRCRGDGVLREGDTVEGCLVGVTAPFGDDVPADAHEIAWRELKSCRRDECVEGRSRLDGDVRVVDRHLDGSVAPGLQAKDGGQREDNENRHADTRALCGGIPRGRELRGIRRDIFPRDDGEALLLRLARRLSLRFPFIAMRVGTSRHEPFAQVLTNTQRIGGLLAIGAGGARGVAPVHGLWGRGSRRYRPMGRNGVMRRLLRRSLAACVSCFGPGTHFVAFIFNPP